jgi:hypothetical protein
MSWALDVSANPVYLPEKHEPICTKLIINHFRDYFNQAVDGD